MEWLDRTRFLLHITRTKGIARRYFVVNGFDGALTMLGIITGFYISKGEDLRLILGACGGAAVALGVSGFTSAYISERAELRKALVELQDAMVTDLKKSAHARAARWVPLLIAGVNGLAPLVISLLIMTPLVVAHMGLDTVLAPLPFAMLIWPVLRRRVFSYLSTQKAFSTCRMFGCSSVQSTARTSNRMSISLVGCLDR